MAISSERHVLESGEEVSDFCAKFIIQAAKSAIADRGRFTLGVSGGSIVNILANHLVGNPDIQWSKWKVFFCDERLVDFSNDDSTYGLYKTKLVDKEGCYESWIPIDTSLDVKACAADYEKKMREVFSGDWPEFDLLLLGMGPDGHTCSLFPNHKLLQESQKWIAPINDSPKPPPCRVTMTLPVLNHARSVAFIAAGSSKANTIKAIFSPVEDGSLLLPAARVQPVSGSLHWIMDKGAASKL